MRAVLDTNILISACWNPAGLEAAAVRLAIEGAFTLCVSAAVWAEYEDVLSRKKFAALRNRAMLTLQALAPRACNVTPQLQISAATDESDNRFLECAAAAEADFLVTGNGKHFPATYGSTRILNAREFLQHTAKSLPPSSL